MLTFSSTLRIIISIKCQSFDKYYNAVISTSQNRAAAFTGVYLMGFYNISWVLVMALIALNNAGVTKHTFASRDNEYHLNLHSNTKISII